MRKERQLHQATLQALTSALRGGAAQLGRLEQKGGDARSLRIAAEALIDSELVHIQQAVTQQRLSGSGGEGSSNEQAPNSLELFEGVEALTSATIEAVERSDRHIFVVGGRSGNDAHLAALKLRVSRGDIRYVRVLTGDHIRHPLCTHLHDLWEIVELGHLQEDKYGGIWWLTTLLSLDKGLRIVNARLAAEYREYVLDLLKDTAPISGPEFIRSLCKACRSTSNSAA